MFILRITYLCCLTLIRHAYGVDESLPSYEIDGKVCYYCSAGFYWTGDCQVTGTQAQCTPCPYGYYQKTKNIAHYCAPCTKCDQVVRNYEQAAVLVQCSAIFNTVCGCKESYHFLKDHGGNGKGYCKKNSMCPAGSGLFEKASNFSDIKCMECEAGFTFSSAMSFQPCTQCTAVCPNTTHLRNPCNRTHDIICEANILVDRDTGMSKEKTTRKPNHSFYVGIGLGTTAGAVVILTVAVLVVRKNRRTRNNNNMLRRMEQTHYIPPKIPEWMEQCRQGTEILWEKLFLKCPEHVLPDWESFVRRLYMLSGESEKGQHSVDMAKEAFDKELFTSRIRKALVLWKQKFATDDKEIEMFYIFSNAVKQHKNRNK